jgi:CRP/FNR family cyclic AMP-dependent transcriptional regulator
MMFKALPTEGALLILIEVTSSRSNNSVILIASAEVQRVSWISERLTRHLTEPKIFTASDGITAFAKYQNAPANVVIADVELPKLNGLLLADQIMQCRESLSTSFVLCGTPPEQERHVDEVVTGRVQYWIDFADGQAFSNGLVRALNYSSHHDGGDFHLRFLAPDDTLMNEGDRSEFVYFVKRGSLEARKGPLDSEVVLGRIEVGEFVGEMGVISGEPRNARVVAKTECELIEVPAGRFDAILFTRPSWSKALMLTLSKRIQRANETRSDQGRP